MVVIGVPAVVGASPVTHDYTSGSATVTASVNGSLSGESITLTNFAASPVNDRLAG
jgi:hypothetical protein